MVPDRFPTALRGYDKDKVNEAFSNYERTISRLREQVRSSDESIFNCKHNCKKKKIMLNVQKAGILLHLWAQMRNNYLRLQNRRVRS